MITRWLIRRQDAAAQRWLTRCAWRSLASRPERRAGRRREARARTLVVVWDAALTFVARWRR